MFGSIWNFDFTFSTSELESNETKKASFEVFTPDDLVTNNSLIKKPFSYSKRIS